VTAAATIGSLLDQAALAVDEGRFVTPDDDNARDAYRGVLALDPANRGALGGLRTISDVYVQQAIGAMRDDEPIVAIEALAVAKETDAANPAIAVVDDLLLAQGDSLLAKAGLAADDGDAELATALLSEAERYSSVDVDASNALRNQIAKNVQERQFLDRLAIAETHITAGRLLAPSQNNALAALLELKGEREGDSRLQRSMDHLGERLLTRAAFAIAASEFTEATQLLDAADTLGVLTGDIAAAQSSLQRASTRAAVAKAASTKSASLAVQTRSIPESKQETAPPPATSAAAPATLTAATIELPTSEPEASANAKAPTIDVPPQPRTITLSDLAIEKYVAPRFPRSARRRELEGFVEVRFTVNTDGSTGSIETLRAQPGAVFNSSAEKAISQWRFAPRDDVVTTQITLSFALSD
jgi:protein TonB